MLQFAYVLFTSARMLLLHYTQIVKSIWSAMHRASASRLDALASGRYDADVLLAQGIARHLLLNEFLGILGVMFAVHIGHYLSRPPNFYLSFVTAPHYPLRGLRHEESRLKETPPQETVI